jgi:hypothetical protein
MNISGRRSGDFGNMEQTTNSLWSAMGSQERVTISSSLGSNNHILSDTSSSSDDDDYMDEDMDDILTTPQAARAGPTVGSHSTPGATWITGGASPTVNSLLSFQHRQRARKQPKRKFRRSLRLGYNSTAQNVLSRSPPNNAIVSKELPNPHSRRESISWAANQLHISGSESDDNLKSQLEGVDSPSRPGVIRRAVTRRGNLLASLS